MKRMIGTAVILGLVAGLGLHQKAEGFSNRLTINVAGIKGASGQVCYSLYSNAQGFPSNPAQATRAQCIAASTTSSALAFDNLASGTYAVAVFHDANGDGQLNKNGFGIPTEGFGFSKNPLIISGPPKFSDAAFFVAGAGNTIQIQLKHLF